MIAMKFSIELEIGLFPIKSALPELETNRKAKTHRLSYPGHRTAHAARHTEIWGRNPKRTQDSQEQRAQPRSSPRCT